MTGSTVGIIITAVVVVIVVAAWIVLVFYADAHPAWRDEAAVAAGRREDDLAAAPDQAEASPAVSRGAGIRAPQAGGAAPGGPRAA